MLPDPRLLEFTRGLRGRIWLTVAIGVLASTVGVARFALLGWLLGRILAGAALADVVLPALGVAAVMALRGALEYLRARLAHETAGRVQLALRARLFDQVALLGPAWFGVTRTGDALLTLVEGVEQLEVYFGEFLPQLAVAAITPLVIFVLLANFDLPLAALLLSFAWATMLAPTLFQAWDSAASLRRRDAYHGFAAEFLDAIQGLATLKAFGQGRAFAQRLRMRADDVFRSTMWVLATNALSRGITDTGIAVGAAVTLVVGAYRVEAGETTLPVLLMVLMAGVETFRPQRDLRTFLHDGMVGLSAAQGVFRLLEARPQVGWVDTEVACAPAEPSIEFDDVRFAYPGGRAPAHEALTFAVKAGERIGFVGPSGAGKSTVVKLLLRLYDPQAGTVRVGGCDLREMDAEALYSQVAVVSQDTYLFHGTVEDNLRFGRPDASAEQLEAAAREANAHAFISALPNGYATVIGERGIRLSGGQRQRIAIARALLRDAPILVLDEALSAVDARNEQVIQQALDRLMRGRTTLVCAHRLSSVIDCDRILVLDAGAVVESGTHAELMANGPRYRALMAAQLEGDAGDTGIAAAASKVSEVATPTERAAVGEDARGIISASASRLGLGGVMARLAVHARPRAVRVGVVCALGIARVAAFIGVGIVSALVVASLREGGDFERWIVWLAVLAPAAGVLHWLESWLAHDMAFRMLSDMRVALFEKLERIAPAFLLRRRSGDLVAMATHDVELVEYFFAHTLAPAIVAVLVPSAVLAVLWTYAPPLAFALAPFLVVVGLSPFFMRGHIDALAARARDSLAELNAHVVDGVQGLHEVVVFRRVAERRREFLDLARAHLSVRVPFLETLGWQSALLETAVGLGGLAVVLAGASQVASGTLSATLLPMLTLIGIAAFLPVSEIAHVGRQLADTVGATRRLDAVEREPEPLRDGPGVAATTADAPALEFDAVRFAYPGHEQHALDEVSFVAEKGSTTALVGPSGAGKTTVAQLAMRFFDPASGSVRLDGHDARDHALEGLRAKVALVAQDTYLFNESLEANVRMAAPYASDAALHEALRRASLDEFVASLPQGLATPVGERGLRLSGGQRQRVAIARAFLKDSPILILDEATSHLDAVSELVVRDSLTKLMRGRTTIVVAHRLSTVRDADHIVVMQAGRAVESGTHGALLARGGLYRQLVAGQLAAVRAA